MSNYTAPVEDMGFVLKEVVEIEKLCNETGLDGSTVEILDTVLEAAGKLAKEEIEPINKPGDSEGLQLMALEKLPLQLALERPISTLLRGAGARSNSRQPMEDRASHLWSLQVFKRCGILQICLGGYARYLLKEQSKQSH